MTERGTNPAMPMKAQVASHNLNKFLADDAAIACDCGTATTWTARHFVIKGEMKLSVSGLLAAAACGLLCAESAAAAHHCHQVVEFRGDGEFITLLDEAI